MKDLFSAALQNNHVKLGSNSASLFSVVIQDQQWQLIWLKTLLTDEFSPDLILQKAASQLQRDRPAFSRTDIEIKAGQDKQRQDSWFLAAYSGVVGISVLQFLLPE